MSILRTLLTSGLIIILISCGEGKMKVPENIVQEEELVPLLVDVHLIDAMLNQEKKPHAEKYDKAMELYHAVLLKHNIDRAVFDSTIKFYVKYPKEFAKIYDDVIEELSRMEGRLQKIGEAEEGE